MACDEDDLCKTGEHLDGELGRCVPSLAESCPPGTMARLGQSDCLPIGPSSCPAGFMWAADGWGCRAIMPAEACTGASVARLGRSTCLPIHPCDDAFPPPDATHLVTESGLSNTSLPTFSNVHLALEAAGAGSVIAVDEGIWDTIVIIDKSVTLVGRCAAETVITSRFYPGYQILGVTDGAHAVLRGITLKAASHGPIVVDGSRLTLVKSIIEDVQTFGLRVDGAGSEVTLLDTTIRRVSRMEEHDGFAIWVGYGAGLTMRRSELTQANTVGLGVGVDSRALVEDSIIHDHRGRGVELIGSSSVVISRSAIVNNDRGGLLAAEPGSRLALKDSVIQGNRGGLDGGSSGVAVQEDALMTMRGSTARDNEVVGVFISSRAWIDSSVVADGRVFGEQTGRGVEVASGGVADISGTAVVDNRFIGIAASYGGRSTLEITDSLISGTLPGEDGSFGYGVIGDADMTLEGVTIERNHGVGLYSLGGHVSAGSVLVRETKPVVGAPGIGVVASGGARIDLVNSAIVANEDLGIGFEGGTSGLIQTSFVEDNAVGIHPGEGVSLIESGPGREPERGEVILDSETVFRRNILDQGRGALVLPDLPVDL